MRIFEDLNERIERVLSIGDSEISHFNFQLNVLLLLIRSIDKDALAFDVVNGNVFHEKWAECLVLDQEQFPLPFKLDVYELRVDQRHFYISFTHEISCGEEY